MKKLLQKIAWKTRRLNLTVSLLNLYLHDHEGTWGFDVFSIEKDFHSYSLLRFECRFPNGTHVRKFTVDNWDILFISRFLWKEYDKLSDHYLWARHDATGWDKFKLNVLGKLFK
jgi:hypothetical protein